MVIAVLLSTRFRGKGCIGMDRILERVFDYGTLCAKSTLDEGDVAHRALLETCVGGSAPWILTPPGAMEAAAAYPVRFTVPGGFARGEIRSLSGAGAWIATRAPLKLGSRVLVRFDDTEFGTYVFPSVVAAKRAGSRPAVGALFDGQPEHTLFDRAWAPSFMLGKGLLSGARPDYSLAS